jgi:hypothetical protein
MLNAVIIAAASQFGAAFLFEFIFSLLALFHHGHPILQGNPYYILLGISWLSMTLTGVGFWSRNRYLFVSLGILAVGFLIWSLIGFPILVGVLSLALNYLTKIATFSTVTCLYLRQDRNGRGG